MGGRFIPTRAVPCVLALTAAFAAAGPRAPPLVRSLGAVKASASALVTSGGPLDGTHHHPCGAAGAH